MLNTILQSAATVIGTILSAVLLALINKGLNLLDKKYGLEITQSQRDVIQSAIDTGAGAIQLVIQQGRLKPEDVRHDNPIVQTITNHALSNVKESQEALSVTLDHAARMIAARWANKKGEVSIKQIEKPLSN